VQRQRENHVRTIALVRDPDAIGTLAAQLDALAARERALRAELAEVEQRRVAWQIAQTDLATLAAWCSTIAGRVDALGWAQRRSALTALNFAVAVYPNGHTPRYVITADASPPSLSSTT
jgi:hypothetical protein